MERLKDILFDISDIVISLIIVAIIFYVVSWKLNDAMPINMAIFQSDSDIASEATTTEPVETVSITLTETAETLSNESMDNTDPTSAAGSEPASQAVTTAGTEDNSPAVDVTVTIPSGSSGDKISRILFSNGVIDNTDDFLKVVGQLGMGAQLRAGTFTLNNKMSYEQIINILAGRQ